MDVQSSAGPQFLGYIYQIPYSLLLILESEEDTKHTIRLEGLDDIESWREDGIQKLIQLKHHKDPVTTLTDRSADLWRAIRTWSQHLKKGKITLPGVQLVLIATSIAPENSVAWLLSPLKQRRNTHEAYQRLVEISAAPSETLRQFTDAFAQLEPTQQKMLVNSIRVVTEAPGLADIDVQITKLIRVAAPLEHTEKVYEMVIGWWVKRVISHLLGDSASMITAREVLRQVYQAGRCFDPNVLPPYSENEQVPIPANLWQYRFVRQLQQIGVGHRRIAKAFQDYIKAGKDRSKWVHDELLVDGDLLSYNERLVDRWEQIYDTMGDEYKLKHKRSIDESGDQACKKFGLKLYSHVSALEIPIRQRGVAYRYITHGSYQMLADEGDPPSVWWHPLFVERFCEAMCTPCEEES